jgi:hypothetical protein
LRHDGFNGREVGAKLAAALLRILDPVNGDAQACGVISQEGVSASKSLGASLSFDAEEGMQPADLLPQFYMPIASGGLLPGPGSGLHYYHINGCKSVALDKDADIVVTDTLQEDGSGHFCRVTIDKLGKISSITYLGGEELQVESLWSLVGLSSTFLNHLVARWRSNDIPDIVEFLADEWAVALFHDRFMDFCLELKLEMASNDDVRKVAEKAFKGIDLEVGLSSDEIEKLRGKLASSTMDLIHERLLEYLRKNTNHLQTYFLPEKWIMQS